MSRAGRLLLAVGAVLLLATAAIHASGCLMVSEWTESLGPERISGLQLVWLTDSLSWAVTALIWLAASWRPDKSWHAASLLAAAIPLLTGVGILMIEPAFFGGYLLLVSGTLGAAGTALTANGTSHRPLIARAKQDDSGAPETYGGSD